MSVLGNPEVECDIDNRLDFTSEDISSFSICPKAVKNNQWLYTSLFSLRNGKSINSYSILVPGASVSFGHVVGETEGSGSSHYRMSVIYGHPVTHAYFWPAYLLVLRN